MATHRLRSLLYHSKSYSRRILLTSSTDRSFPPFSKCLGEVLPRQEVPAAPARNYASRNRAFTTGWPMNYATTPLSTKALSEEPEKVGLDSEDREVFDYPGAKTSFTHEMQFISHTDFETVPCYRVLDDFGQPIPWAQLPEVDVGLAQKMYTNMVTLQVMDVIFYEAQRQGRFSFYMTTRGEEAINIATAAALSSEDIVYTQYREPGILMWRGFSTEDFANQCFGNSEDLGKGRQMPCHYGSRELNYPTVSSPIGLKLKHQPELQTHEDMFFATYDLIERADLRSYAMLQIVANCKSYNEFQFRPSGSGSTQLPQAVGSGYAMKMAGTPACTVALFGDGASSQGDFHAALNFAATLETPTLFICRNNGWAISTHVKDQFRSDGVVVKGRAYGVHSIRVDGNDALALYSIVKAARKMAIEENRPILIEALSYRVGHHSTSDDSTKYRRRDEIDHWRMQRDPVLRFKRWMEAKGWWDADSEKKLRAATRKEVIAAMTKAERMRKPELFDLFTDVYDAIPPNLKEQEKHLRDTVARHPKTYPKDVPL